ncbi:MAG: hypothetical protein ABEH77_00850 [Halobacteriaceae archaeon]
MGAREFDRVEDWESRPFEGQEDLQRLAEQEFSGAVRAGCTWVFLLNGRAVGEFGGTVEGIADSSGTVYTAPHPALPLLLAMREVGGETRARYYTNETPLTEVDDTLASSGFTGYVELSEHVHSGDYYVLYYGGRSMSLAFIGESEELVTDEEAFERANDEVGIFEVVAADIEVTDIDGAVGDTAGAPGGGSEPAAGGADNGDPAAEPSPTAGDPRTGTEDAPAADDEGETGQNEAAAEAAGARRDAEPAADTGERPPASTEAEPAASGGGGAAGGGGETAEAESVEGAADPERTEPAAGEAETVDAEAAEEAGVDDDKFSREEEWRETRTIPALDPEETEPDDGGEADGPADDEAEPNPEAVEEPAREPEPEDPEPGGEAANRIRQLRDALEERTEELEALRERADELASARDELRAERDRLADRVDELERELEAARAEAEAGAGGDAAGSGAAAADADGPSLDPERALAETNLFVQYESQGGKPTLEEARDDGADSDAVNENLRLEYHTQFEGAGATVGADPFEEFLAASPEYRFVEWVVRDLLYEIREAGHRSELADLYDAIPEIYRIELRGDVEVPIDEEEGGVDTRGFDIVLRDRMGDPLMVADINDSRDPVTREMMETLVETAGDAAGAADLATAFYVTASFFSPGSLEAATDATGGGLLSRNSRESFVRTGRKAGYHLCLVESRDDSFYLTVPEL